MLGHSDAAVRGCFPICSSPGGPGSCDPACARQCSRGNRSDLATAAARGLPGSDQGERDCRLRPWRRRRVSGPIFERTGPELAQGDARRGATGTRPRPKVRRGDRIDRLHPAALPASTHDHDRSVGNSGDAEGLRRRESGEWRNAGPIGRISRRGSASPAAARRGWASLQADAEPRSPPPRALRE
jgi:hypothetical protein